MTDGLSNTVFLSERAVPTSKYDLGSIISGMGLSIAHDPRLCLAFKGSGHTLNQKAVDDSGYNVSTWEATGRRISCHYPMYTLFYTVLPPNSPSCSETLAEGPGPVSANSYHTGGVNLSMGDGSVHFVSNTVDYGQPIDGVYGQGTADDSSGRSGISPFGVWGAMGSINGGESQTAL